MATRALRRRYQRHTKKVTGRTTVYSASAWWPDNDPSEQVIALNAATAERMIHNLMKDAEQREIEDRDEGESTPAMRWSGVHSFALADLVRERHLKEAIRDLKDHGYTYPETR